MSKAHQISHAVFLGVLNNVRYVFFLLKLASLSRHNVCKKTCICSVSRQHAAANVNMISLKIQENIDPSHYVTSKNVDSISGKMEQLKF